MGRKRIRITHIMTTVRTRVGAEKAAILTTLRPAFLVVMDEKKAFTNLWPLVVRPSNTGPCQSSTQMSIIWAAFNTHTVNTSHIVSVRGKR